MKTNLSLSNPAEVETECLVAIVLDRAEKGRGDKERPDKDVQKKTSRKSRLKPQTPP